MFLVVGDDITIIIGCGIYQDIVEEDAESKLGLVKGDSILTYFCSVFVSEMRSKVRCNASSRFSVQNSGPSYS